MVRKFNWKTTRSLPQRNSNGTNQPRIQEKVVRRAASEIKTLTTGHEGAQRNNHRGGKAKASLWSSASQVLPSVL